MKILFAGDLSLSDLDTCDENCARDCMRDASSAFQRADYGMINLETVFGDPKEAVPIAKTGPNLIMSPAFKAYVDVLRPTVIGLANNHAGDYGRDPLLNTISRLRQDGYLCVGAGENIEEAYRPAVLESPIPEEKGIRVSILAVCENEFGVADGARPGSAGYGLGRVTRAVKAAIHEGTIPILYFHGGNEHNPFPSPGKKDLYRHFIDLGAGAVIAMHTHCPQGYETYKGRPIVYSMGNFYFPMHHVTKTSWNYGYLTELHITKDGIGLEALPYRFDFKRLILLEGEAKSDFMEYLRYLSDAIGDDRRLREYFDAWSVMLGINGYAKYLQFSKDMADDGPEGVVAIRNNFTCEAHNELLSHALNLIYEGRVEEASRKIDEIRLLQSMRLPSKTGGQLC